MVTQWNERVKPGDHVTCLGDLTLDRGTASGKEAQKLIRLVRSLNGQKRLLLGNHDHFPTQVYLECRFQKIYATHKNEHNWLLSHFPIHGTSLGPVIANIHGHIHNQKSPPPYIFKGYKTVWNTDSSSSKGTIQPYINICVENTGYGPINVGEVKRLIKEAVESYKESEDGKSAGV